MMILKYGSDNTKVSKIVSNEKHSLVLDENNEIKEVKFLEYNVLLQKPEEYENIEHIIVGDVLQGIEVCESFPEFEKLMWRCNTLPTAHDFVITFTTNDENKFDSLERIIKEIMIKNKEFLH